MRGGNKNLVIGLNSGTSFDGVDVALVKFKKGNLKPYFIDGFVYEYPKIVKEKIRKLINVETHGHASLREISQLNFLLGEIFASAALKIIKKNKLKTKDILLIASHGQTIYHHPKIEKMLGYKIRSTLQIGESSVIAQQTGIKTISNFREVDIAAGGQGAPLMPFLDWVLFDKSKNIKAIINIGGISNVTVLGKNITPIAFDIGPGNALIDLAVKKYFNKDYDEDGKIAMKGEIFYKTIERALRDPYFKKKPPKSTGKEYFGIDFLKKHFPNLETIHELSLLATLTYFSAKVIEKAFKDFIFPKYDVREIVISGGGVKNKTLIKHLQTCHDVPLRTSDKYGIPSRYKEAILFALLGYTCHIGKKNNIPSCTGAQKGTVLGKMTFV